MVVILYKLNLKTQKHKLDSKKMNLENLDKIIVEMSHELNFENHYINLIQINTNIE